MLRNAEEILNGLDILFAEHRMAEVEPYLQQALQEAMGNKDSSLVITIVNELIGFYRDTSQYEKSLYYCEQILPFMEMRGLKGSIHYATTCLNVANACRAAGEWESSLRYYKEVKQVYDQLLAPSDSLYASYYNNLSLLYQEMGQFEEACDCLKKALYIIEQYQDIIKIAITCSNLAVSLLRCGEQQQAEEYLNRALQIFIEDGEVDFHYGAALSVMGELQFQKQNYEESLQYYQKALAELEKHVGKTEYYYRTLDNLEQVEKILNKNNGNDDLSTDLRVNNDSVDSQNNHGIKNKSLGQQMFEDFYYEYGEPMLKRKFPDFLDKIAIGKVGEGSECFGFEDELSLDHDFGPGFCMWVTKDTYEQIGEYLQAEYDKLPATFRGVTRKTMEQGKGRVGVCIIEDFYERILGMKKAPKTLEEWSRVEEFALAAATNGWVLRDEEGIFTSIRNQISAYYPESIWRSRMAQTMYHLSQYGQYNYGRMAKRADIVTAEQCRSQFIKSAMEMVYLLNRTYAPYYKWRFRGMEGLNSFGIGERLRELIFIPVMNLEDNEEMMERICICLLEQMEKMKLITRNPQTTYMEHYIGQVLGSLTHQNENTSRCIEDDAKSKDGIEKSKKENRQKNTEKESGSRENLNGNKNREESMKKFTEVENKQNMAESYVNVNNIKNKENLVKHLVKLEWQNFDQVQNEGGRADCQDDWNTFSIMRTSQYLTWNEEMLQSYIQDFEEAMAKGWNLITEKYGRMMESTAAWRFEEIKEQLPYLPEEKKAIIEEIVKIQVGWMEDFASKYPNMAGNSRVIHTSEDTPYSTSFETYLRGELGTYSDRTLDLYGRFIVSYLQAEQNLTKDIMTNTALLYGYESLEKAEELLRG